jgi:hypothetical protein
MNTMRILLITVMWGVLIATPARCQSPTDTSSHSASIPVCVSASVNAATDFYSSSGISPRQPSGISRLIIRPTITLFDQIQLPFEVYLSSTSYTYQQPFNQFGVNPRIGNWLVLHAGYFSARVSGDVRLLGGGVEVKPGAFSITFLYGSSRQARGPDSSAQFHGAYQRTAWVGSIGYGAEGSFHAQLNLAHAVDDSASITAARVHASLAAGQDSAGGLIMRDTLIADPALASPQENLALTFNFAAPIAPFLGINGEFGVAALSNDIRIAALAGGSWVPSFLLTPRGSTQVDGAARMAIQITPSNVWNVKLNARWIGPGYVTLGYAQLVNDVMDVTLAPSVKIGGSTAYIRGSLGLQWNNLRSTKLGTTQRTIGSCSAGWNITPEAGIDLQYSNYGTRSNYRNDTLRVDNVYRLISFTPHMSFTGWDATHMITGSYSYNDVADNIAVTAGHTHNQSHALSLMHAMSWPSTLSLSTSAFATYVEQSAMIMRIVNISETGSHMFLDARLNASLSLGYGLTTIAGNSDGQVIVRMMSSYSLEKYGTVSLSLSTSSYNASSTISTTASFKESSGSLQYSLSL